MDCNPCRWGQVQVLWIFPDRNPRHSIFDQKPLLVTKRVFPWYLSMHMTFLLRWVDFKIQILNPKPVTQTRWSMCQLGKNRKLTGEWQESWKNIQLWSVYIISFQHSLLHPWISCNLKSQHELPLINNFWRVPERQSVVFAFVIMFFCQQR